MNPDGSGQTRLTNNTARDQEPAWSIDSSKIVFISNRDGNDEIYMMGSDGTGQTRLTTNTASDIFPAYGIINYLTAAFTTNTSSGTTPLAVQFTDVSSGNGITEWNWSFGDGTWENRTSSTNPVHTYTTGTWLPTLKVTNASGNNTSLTRTITVTPTPLPVLTIVANQTTVTAGTPASVNFLVRNQSSGLAVSGATITLTGVATGTGTTGADGNATISVNATGAGSITATASMAGYTSNTTTITANAAQEHYRY